MQTAHDLADQTYSSADDEGIDLLDIALTVAENIKLLILGPIVAAVIAGGAYTLLPAKYESTTVLQIDQTHAALLTTAVVLDPVAVSFGFTKDSTVEAARLKLKNNIDVNIGKLDKLCTMVVLGSSPQEAQAVSKALLDQLYVVSRPRGSIKTRLETQKSEAIERLATAQSAGAVFLKRVGTLDAKNGAGADLARGYADMLGSAAAAQAQISLIESQIEGVTAAVVLQQPTLAQAAKSIRLKVVLGAFVFVGLLLLVFVLVRKSLNGRSIASGSAEKLALIRQALGFGAASKAQ